ncbi:hypothetical protein D3C75_1206880 [compost metagenome]
MVPAMLLKMEPPPVSGSFGRLSFFELCASKLSLKRSVTFQTAFRPSEPSLYFCMLRCCSRPKSLVPAISRM